MDRALKERLVGAAVLVVFIVLVVPVFLDGPAEEPLVVSENMTLPGQGGQERKRQTIVLERDRKVPVPAGQEPTATENAVIKPPATDVPSPVVAPAAAEVLPEEPAQAPAAKAATGPQPRAEQPAPPPAAATQSATGMWAVQLGSFSRKDNADRLAAELRSKGYAAFLSQLSASEAPLHRVRIGPQKDRKSAEAVAARLQADGHKGQVVPHP